nr:MAG TPA_asm: hypothetical protein [Caudoviricetes sp.]
MWHPLPDGKRSFWCWGWSRPSYRRLLKRQMQFAMG